MRYCTVLVRYPRRAIVGVPSEGRNKSRESSRGQIARRPSFARNISQQGFCREGGQGGGRKVGVQPLFMLCVQVDNIPVVRAKREKGQYRISDLRSSSALCLRLTTMPSTRTSVNQP